MIDPFSTTLYPTAAALYELRRKRPALYVHELRDELERVSLAQEIDVEQIRVYFTTGLDRIPDDALAYAAHHEDSKLYAKGCAGGLWDPHLDPATALYDPVEGEVGVSVDGARVWLWTFDDPRHQLITQTLNDIAIPTPGAQYRGELVEHCVTVERGVVSGHASAALVDLGLRAIAVDDNGRPIPRAAT